MGYRGVPVRGPRPTHKQAALDQKRKSQRAGDLQIRIDQARGRQSTYAMWSARRWALLMSRVSWAYLAFCTGYMIVFGVASGPLAGAATALLAGLVSRKIVKVKTAQILAWHYPSPDNSVRDAKLAELKAAGPQPEEDDDPEMRPMSDVEWQRGAYGPGTIWSETANAIERIDKELMELERAQARARSDALWNAMPDAAKELGCSHCRSMSHAAELCMNQPLKPLRKRVIGPDGEEHWITSWGASGELIADYVDPDDLPDYTRKPESYSDYTRNEKVLRSARDKNRGKGRIDFKTGKIGWS